MSLGTVHSGYSSLQPEIHPSHLKNAASAVATHVEKRKSVRTTWKARAQGSHFYQGGVTSALGGNDRGVIFAGESLLTVTPGKRLYALGN